jgi:alkylation response protein AidB-like acyl-CoA dehydrogenase
MDAVLRAMAGAVHDPGAARWLLDRAVGVTLDAVQLHGGYGYLREYGVEGLARDAVSLRAAAQNMP